MHKVCNISNVSFDKILWIMKTTNSFLENLDPRAKIVSFLVIIFCMILTPISRFKDFGFYFLLILAITFTSTVTLKHVFKRVMVVIPFVIFIAVFVPFLKEGTVYWSLKIGYWELDITYEGIMTFLNIIVKSSLSIFLLVVASSTTPFADFLKGLDLLRIPRLMIMLMSFLYRYLFVLLDEARRLMRARSLRYFGSRYREQFRVIGYMIGVLFIRTFERAERIYSAMVVRGFHGEIPATKHFKLSYRDFFFIIGIIIFLISIVSGLVYKLEFLKKVYDIRLWQRL